MSKKLQNFEVIMIKPGPNLLDGSKFLMDLDFDGGQLAVSQLVSVRPTSAVALLRVD